MFNTPTSATYTLRVLAALLRYPDAAFRTAVPELQQALRAEAALPAGRLDELCALWDRVLVLFRGKLVATLGSAELSRARLLSAMMGNAA